MLIAVSLLLGGCSEHEPVPVSRCERYLDLYDPTFGIDRTNPSDYLIPGAQSDLDSSYFQQVKNSLGEVAITVQGAKSVAYWVGQHFTFVNKGGSMIGVLTVDQHFEKMEFYGCHSQALIISSILRSYGFPSLLVETASVKWAKDYAIDPNTPFIGHVMTEVCIQGQWMLLDNNGAIVQVYEYDTPFIDTRTSTLSQPAPEGLFAIGKGLDHWDYGVTGSWDTHELMVGYSMYDDCLESYTEDLDYLWE